MRDDLLAAIKRLTRERGYPPTFRELGDEVGLSSTATIHHHLHRLQEAGLIVFDAAKSRTVRLLK